MNTTRHRRVFLDWNQSALDRATEFLTEGWASGPLDLRDCLLVVPTRHAGRRLRERLAMAAAARGTGVLIGRVETPAFLFAPAPDAKPLASGAAADLFWRRALEQAAPDVLRALGRETIATDATIRGAAAAHVRGLRDQLGEEGYDLRSFAATIESNHPDDATRWQALAALEELFVHVVDQAGWRDDVSAKLAMADAPALPADIKRVVMMFVADPPPLALRVLEKWSAQVKVTVCVHAPESKRETFDAWGRPLVASWSRAELSLTPAMVEVCDTSITVTERIRGMIEGSSAEQRRQMVVGVSAPDTASRVRMTLARDGVSTFDPSGQPARQSALFNLVDRFMQLARKKNIDALDLVLRHPFVLRRLETDLQPRESLLAIWDEFLNHHIPSTFEAALALRDHYDPDTYGLDEAQRAARQEERKRLLGGMFDAVQRWLAAWHRGRLSESLPALMADLLDGWPVDEAFEREAGKLSDTLDRLAGIEPLCRDGEEAADMLRLLVDGQAFTSHRREDDVDILGWLELPWEDAPSLLLTDLNDGLVPESIAVDAFLPDGARARCGLRDNEFRLARDAYLLEVLVQSRPAGQLRGLMARRDAGGELLKPSRLLFMGAPEEVPQRVLHYFSEGASAFVATDRTPAWRLKGAPPDMLAERRRFSPSEIRTYLQCPFRYYLKKAMKLGDPFERKLELDAMDFGNVVHDVFYAFALSAHAQQTDAAKIETFLHAELDRYLAARFGDARPLALTVQRDVLQQRLSYAARVQAEWRAQGWCILPDECEKEGQIEVAGDIISFRIDRIDRHEQTGAVCVIDYKTSQAGDKPESTHLKRDKAGVPKEKAFAAAPGEGMWWTDLQLPLYAAVARERLAASKGAVQAAYFSLPGAVADTKIQVWEGFKDDHIDSALACASRVFQRIRDGVFWPPDEEFSERDREINLFFDGIRQHLDVETLTALEEAAR